MKLCVIGNSHVGMVRAAERALGADAPDVTYFAKAGSGIERARVRGPVIAADDPELRTAQARFAMPHEIDVSRFDAILLVAGTASVYGALRSLQHHRVSGWAACAAAPEAEMGPVLPDKVLVSEPAFVAALTDQAGAGYSHRFATAFRQATEVPIYLVPQPYPSERVFENTGPGAYGFHRVRTAGDGPAIAACLARAIDAAFDRLGNLTVLHQPDDTVAHGFTTARAYTRDAVRVDGDTAQHETDLLHVGAAYGKRVLARVAAGLDGARAA